MRSRWARRMIPRFIAVITIFVLGFVSFFSTQNFNPDLMVLCSNNTATCQALVRDYAQHTGNTVRMVRMPTSQALASVSSSVRQTEFDVWIGGPAQAYVLAQRRHLLAPHQLDTADIPAAMATQTWVGTYGGILAFCVAADKPTPHTWEELARYHGRLALPSPFSSGTAATMLSVQAARGASIDYLRNLNSATTVYTASGTAPGKLVGNGRVDVAVTFEAYCPINSADPHAPHLVIPRDGTGYEIGAGAVLAQGHQEAGRDFLRYVISEHGQHITAQAEGQNPISLRLKNNLATRLAAITVPLYGTDIDDSASQRTHILRVFADQVSYRYGLWLPLLRSAVVSGLGAVLAVLNGGLLALAYRMLRQRFRALVAVVASVPIIFPSVAIASPLVAGPLALDPYSHTVLIITYAIYATPLAFFICTISTSGVTTSAALLAGSAGLSPLQVIKLHYLPRLLRGMAISTLAATLWLMADNSAGAVYGGREQLFSTMVLNSVSMNYHPQFMLFICIVIAIIGACAVYRRNHDFGVPDTSSRTWVRTESQSNNPRLNFVSEQFFLRPCRWLFAWVLCWIGVISYLLLVMITSADFHILSQYSLIRAGLHVWLGLGLSALAVFIGIVLAMRTWNYPHRVDAVMVFLLLSSPIAVGLFFTLVLRTAIELDGIVIMPAIVGSYSFGYGSIAVGIAYLSFAIPAAYFLTTMITARLQPVIHAAQDSGAGTMRILVLIVAHRRAQISALVAIIFGLTLAQSATLAFIQPAYLMTSATNVLHLAERGAYAEVCATALFTGTIGALFMGSGAGVFAWSRRRELRKKYES